MSGTPAISTNIDTPAVIKFFFLQGKTPKEIHAILKETLACFLPSRAKDLSALLYKHDFLFNKSIAWFKKNVIFNPKQKLLDQMRDSPFLKKGPVKWHYLLSEGDLHVAESVTASYCFLFHAATAPNGPRPSHCRGLTITLRHTTLRRIPLDEWSARRRDLYLTTHNTHNRQISMAPAGFEPAIPSNERQQTCALARAATGIGTVTNSIFPLSTVNCMLRDSF